MTWRTCSSCKKEIALGATYFACSVSTCNRARLALYFCSVACWDAHLPEARHREAWAEEKRAPTVPEADDAPVRRVVAPASPAASAAAPASDDVLVVVSKLKAYIKAQSGMNTSDGVASALSDHLRRLCARAADNAARDGRKTVMDRDFVGLI
jgi:hypothetical protein